MFASKEPKQSKQHRQAAKLAAAIAHRRKIQRPVKLANWEVWFFRLKQEVGSKRVKQVLKWYCDHISDTYVPAAYSAKTFYDKFLQIEDAMRRDQPQEKKQTVLITKTGKDVTEWLRRFQWPKGSASDLLVTVQESLDEYEEFLQLRRQVNALIIMGTLRVVDSDLQRIAGMSNYLTGKLGPPPQFIDTWMAKVFDNLNGWDDWSGKLISYAFLIEGDRFARLGKELATDYCNDSRRWDLFMDQIRKLRNE